MSSRIGLSVRVGSWFVIILTLFVSPVLAQTQYLPPADHEFTGPVPTGPRDGGRLIWPVGRINYMFELDQIVQFLASWQSLEPDSDFGGMIEAEGGDLGDVIQTDNTLEAIWVWSHYTELTGSATYLQNIADAWTYCVRYPPWLEEGGDGYYRVHNAAWGLTAESAYRAATGDTSYLSYAATCADYIVDTPLYIAQGQLLNTFCQSWASGNLFLYAQEMANSVWRDAALAYGETLLNWIAVNPATNLAAEYWAMSSGTVVWSVCNSVFIDDPVRGSDWVATNGALVDTFQVWYNVPGDGYDWDNSWNVAYLNAHFAMGDLSDNGLHTDFGEKLTRQLLSYDSDNDGGIPATTQDPVTEDMSWVTSYLAKFGVARMLGQPAAVDAGVLSFSGLADGDLITVSASSPLNIRVEASNFGLDPLTGVEVQLLSPTTGSAVCDLDFVQSQRLTLATGWLPPHGGDYEFVAVSSVSGDTNTVNDTLRITVTISYPAAADNQLASDTAAPLITPLGANPFRDSARFALDLPADRAVAVEIISAEGRRLNGWNFAPGAQRRETLAWNGKASDGAPAPAGIYFVRASSGGAVSAKRILKLSR